MEIEFDVAIRKSRDWLQATLASIGDAVVAAGAVTLFHAIIPVDLEKLRGTRRLFVP